MVKKSVHDEPSALETGLAWARLSRTGLMSDLSAETRSVVRGELLAWLDEPKIEPPVKAVEPTTPRSPSPPPPMPDYGTEQYEVELRRLVEGEASWSSIRDVAYRLYDLRHDAETAAKTVELAFLHGSVAELVESLTHFFSFGREFFWLVHPAVRSHLIVKLWRAGRAQMLAAHMMPDRENEGLQKIERFFLFHSMMDAKDPTGPFLYFRRYRRQLVEGASELGDYFDLRPSRFLLQVGKMAIDLGYDDEARRLLSPIDDADPEYGEAMRLLLSARSRRDQMGQSEYRERIQNCAHYTDKVSLLRQYLATTRELGGVRDENRPALNDLLADILQLVPPDPDAWLAVSRTMFENRDLNMLLPNVVGLYRVRALQFTQPELDDALWAPPASSRGEDIDTAYWRGIAKLHRYVAGGPKMERLLWYARDEVQRTTAVLTENAPFRWDELHRAAQTYVSRNPHLTESDRAGMIQQLRLAVSGHQAASVDIEKYVRNASHPPLSVLASLQTMAAAKEDALLELSIIRRQAQESHYTNAQLNRTWQLACSSQQSDLAWRIATVANARTALHTSLIHPWSISGEKRREYGMVPASMQAVEFALQGFTVEQQRLIHAVVEVGGAIPEVLAMLDSSSRSTKKSNYKADTVDYRIDKLLDKISWVPNTRKHWLFSQDALGSMNRLPAFVHVLPANPWSSIVCQLTDRLGIYSWNWKLSRLYSQMEELIPKLAYRQGLRGYSSKVARWLKSLTPEQRTSWQDLAMLSKAIDDQEAGDTLAKFVCRMATVVYQNHYMALSSLRTMRADVVIVQDLEHWILSEDYSRMRKKLGTASRVPIPASLSRMEKITS